MIIVSASLVLFADSSIKANVEKFQGVIRTGSINKTDIQVSLGDVDIAFVKKIDVLDVYIDGKLNFNEHVHDDSKSYFVLTFDIYFNAYEVLNTYLTLWESLNVVHCVF